MSETPVQPDLEDELPEPTQPPKEPFVSKWDIVVFVALVVFGTGFWMWYDGQGKDSRAHFAHADSLYKAGRFPAALDAYRLIRENEQVVSKTDDSLLYLRVDSLSELEDHANRLMQGAELAIASKDTALIRRALVTLSADSTGFIADSSKKHLEAALGIK